ncbi:Imm1 family immunity protein [Micromonospora sp. NBC_01699]
MAFDFYGDWTEMPPERTRVTTEQARRAAHDCVHTGTQPTLPAWVAGGVS